MLLNEFGIIADTRISSLPDRFENTTIESSVVMPNHVHLVVVIRRSVDPVVPVVNPTGAIPVGAIHELPLRELPGREPTPPELLKINRKTRRVMTIPKIVGYYRMNVAKRINEIRNTPGIPLW